MVTAPPLPSTRSQADHCIDLPFGFDLLDAEGDAPSRTLADADAPGLGLLRVRAGPGEKWPPCTAESRATMVRDADPRIGRDG
ncbi:hypothetical protein ACWDX6_26710 [Streptomyces sp. NPDC003027]